VSAATTVAVSTDAMREIRSGHSSENQCDIGPTRNVHAPG
jgi:hypothetical protein